MRARIGFIATIAFTMWLCACGTAAKSGVTSTTVTHPSSHSTTSSSSTSVATTSTTVGGCAARAAETFIYIDSVAPNAVGGLTVNGNQAKLVCGGPDDFHWNTAAITGLQEQFHP